MRYLHHLAALDNLSRHAKSSKLLSAKSTVVLNGLGTNL